MPSSSKTRNLAQLARRWALNTSFSSKANETVDAFRHRQQQKRKRANTEQSSSCVYRFLTSERSLNNIFASNGSHVHHGWFIVISWQAFYCSTFNRIFPRNNKRKYDGRKAFRFTFDRLIATALSSSTGREENCVTRLVSRLESTRIRRIDVKTCLVDEHRQERSLSTLFLAFRYNEK